MTPADVNGFRGTFADSHLKIARGYGTDAAGNPVPS